MTQLLAMLVFLVPGGLSSVDSTLLDQQSATGDTPESRTIHLLPSAYGSFGSYSTGTRSRSASAYLTLSDSWRDYYTVGFSTLWLERDDAGGRYYTQGVATARASWFLGTRISVSAHYAYLHEGEIASYSPPTDFHLSGIGGSYWFSYNTVVGASGTIALSSGSAQAMIARAVFSHHLGAGFWTTSTVTTGNTRWTPAVAAWRQSLVIPLGGEHSIVASADIGRSVFYFDDELLVVYNQREVQTRFFQLKGVICILERTYLLPSLEYDEFESYNVTYASVGVRMVF